MRDRFGLAPGGEGRPGIDAVLPIPNVGPVPFEIKSSDTSEAEHQRRGGSVSTARDVGREHIEKWRRRHWLFGFYVRGSRNPPTARYYLYASPRQLEPWIAEQEAYAVPDWDLVRLLPELADGELLAAVAGKKPHYTLQDAKRLLKQQKLEAGEHMLPELRALLLSSGMSAEPRKMGMPVYRALMDLQEGYSPDRMLVLLRERARYLLDRGATRNNPHIPERRLHQLVPADQVVPGDADRRAQRLEELVRRELQAMAEATDPASA
jgi:hypothetical protein